MHWFGYIVLAFVVGTFLLQVRLATALARESKGKVSGRESFFLMQRPWRSSTRDDAEFEVALQRAQWTLFRVSSLGAIFLVMLLLVLLIFRH